MFGSTRNFANTEVKMDATRYIFNDENSNEQGVSLRIVNFIQSQRIADAGVYFSC
ncbi:hypothetical protein CES85_3979 [Ochrobactrum quorumnocens]|uniref:Uncharacterized protein n=1 Tax=Ochrobactrum quorumnocens TaxID=271865 RepID=A0A248U9W4_9HYPH|nr:hypothetical protein CES85_3979 [[Ochrobactrum] quorumnocens]